MQKTVLSLIALTGALCFFPANASSVARIIAIESPVWVYHNNSKTELNHNSDLKIGDQIITGDSGRVEMQLSSNAILQLNTNSEIRILAQKKTETGSPDNQSKLYVHDGRACIKYNSQPSTEAKFEVDIGNSLIAAIHNHGHICVTRRDGLSSINLRDGSVQITQTTDQNIVILSEAGTEFRIDDGGSYNLFFPGTDDSFTVENDPPFVTETQLEEETLGDEIEAVDSNIAAIDIVEVNDSKPAVGKNEPDYIYTVYLFSTRDEDVANRVNKKFQKAGHKSIILTIAKDSLTFHRIAVSGFKSHQSAEDFSSSIVGRLGVTDTWIGKDRQRN